VGERRTAFDEAPRCPAGHPRGSALTAPRALIGIAIASLKANTEDKNRRANEQG